MLIYGIFRHITNPSPYFMLSCTFPSGHGHINVKLIQSGQPIGFVQKFELNPETPVEVPVLLSSQNKT